jgi:hypothetical protein
MIQGSGVECRPDVSLAGPFGAKVACRREAVIDKHAAAFLPAISLKCLPECHEPGLYLRVTFGVADEHPDPAGRLLRARRERPRDSRAAEQRDESAAPIKKTRSHGTIAKRVGLAKRPRSAKRLPFSLSRVGQWPVRNSFD